MKIAYTICTTNHLSFAKTMADSFIKYNSSYKLIIGLADKISKEIDLKNFERYEILEAHKLGDGILSTFPSDYSLLELACALKPFYALHFLNEYKATNVVYIDTDIIFFKHINEIDASFKKSSILITPHYTKPLPIDDFIPYERDTLRSGLFNAGFFAVNDSQQAKDFLNWWGRHLQKEGYLNFSEGMGADQNWLNLAPFFFSSCEIFLNEGYNVAYWNLHERALTKANNIILVNEKIPLTFFHLSGYNIENPSALSKHQNRYALKQFPIINDICKSYSDLVIENGYYKYKIYGSSYAQKPKKSLGVLKFFNKMLKPIGFKLISN